MDAGCFLGDKHGFTTGKYQMVKRDPDGNERVVGKGSYITWWWGRKDNDGKMARDPGHRNAVITGNALIQLTEGKREAPFSLRYFWHFLLFCATRMDTLKTMKHEMLGIPPVLRLPENVMLPRLPKGDSEFPLRIMDIVWVALAVGLIVAQIARLSMISEIWTWTSLLAVLLAMPAADFVSGMIHWTFDTWGSEKTFFIGSRLIRPFRVHHTKPKDLLGSHFFTTNADASLANIPILLLAFCCPTDWEAGRIAAVFLVALGTFGLPTSQIHKWSHASRRPRWVSWLQRRGLILGPIHHAVHHAEPHTVNYCITTGWCNAPLLWIGFFPKMEWLVSKLTGMTPRKEEHDATKPV